MYLLKYSKRFKRDLKRINKRKGLNADLFEKILRLMRYIGNTSVLPKTEDLGKLKDCYACHLEPDLVIIYQKDKKNKIIYLLRIGSHSELF
jgi:mRNA interferase YafQ